MNTPKYIQGFRKFLVVTTKSAWSGVLNRIYFQPSTAQEIIHEGNQGGDGPLGQRQGHAKQRATALFAFVPWLFQVIVVKLVAMQYLPMFPPTKLILSSHKEIFDITNDESFQDAKLRMESRPLLELLFCKNDMMWIMSMVFYSEDAASGPLFYSSAIGGAVFGSIHCLAWSFDFPSFAERTLWRSASIAIVGACICVVPGIFIHGVLCAKETDCIDNTIASRFWLSMRKMCELIPCIIYPIARTSLLLLAIASLRAIPSSALDAIQWIQLIPHI